MKYVFKGPDKIRDLLALKGKERPDRDYTYKVRAYYPDILVTGDSPAECAGYLFADPDINVHDAIEIEVDVIAHVMSSDDDES